MNPVLLLMALLALAYVGGDVASPGRRRARPRSSGVALLVLGFLIGPGVSGLVARATVAAFDPVLFAGIGWVAAVAGLEYGAGGDARRTDARARALGALLAVVFVGVVGVALLATLRVVAPQAFDRDGRALLIVAAAVAGGGTSSHAARWAAARGARSGLAARMAAELAAGGDVVPLVATAFVVARLGEGASTGAVALPSWALGVVDVGAGLALGAALAALLARERRAVESWGLLLGAAAMLTGLSRQAGLSVVAPMFAFGAALGALSRHGADVAAFVAPTKRGVLLPVLLLAGAHAEVGTGGPLLALVAAGFAARALVAFGAGALLVRGAGARDGRAWRTTSLGLLSIGSVGIVAALDVALKVGGAVGARLIGLATGVMLVAELVGPAGLERIARMAAPARAGDA